MVSKHLNSCWTLFKEAWSLTPERYRQLLQVRRSIRWCHKKHLVAPEKALVRSLARIPECSRTPWPQLFCSGEHDNKFFREQFLSPDCPGSPRCIFRRNARTFRWTSCYARWCSWYLHRPRASFAGCIWNASWSAARYPPPFYPAQRYSLYLKQRHVSGSEVGIEIEREIETNRYWNMNRYGNRNRNRNVY